MTTTTIGVIGAGRIGKLHMENLTRMPGIRLKAVSDVAPEPIREWAAGLGIAQLTTDYRELLRDPEIDAVFICSSTDSHVPIILDASRAGKHMFCEKPISMDYRQSKLAVEAAAAAGVVLQVGFNRRFDPSFSRVRELVREGRLGDPHLIKITSRDPSPPPAEYIKVSGGLFIDMAIHDFDMARFLAGSDVVEVYAQGAVLVDPVFAQHGDIDTAVITLRFAGGALGVIDNSRKAVYGYDQRVEVFGSQGSAAAANDFPNRTVWMTGDGVFRDKPLHFFLERYREAYVREVQAFVESIRTGKPAPVDGNDGLQAERIAHAAKKSLREGRPVRLTELDEGGEHA